MSLRLRCTVRNCERELARDDGVLRCEKGHAYDRAREGYWNLLQPQDRKSTEAGDRDEAIDARRRWLARGNAFGLVATLRGIVDRLGLPPASAAIDAGCGEGTITSGVLGGRGFEVCGIDLAAKAIRLASRVDPSVTWVVANADRMLPIADRSVDLAVSIFGRRPAAELCRVLVPGSVLLVVIPAEDDLIELRAEAQGDAARRDRVPAIIEELASGLTLEHRTAWRDRAFHDRAALEDALAMSYRGARFAERTRMANLQSAEVTLAAEILLFRRG